MEAKKTDTDNLVGVKIVNKHMDNNSNEVGEYAVSVAKAVVEGLKRR